MSTTDAVAEFPADEDFAASENAFSLRSAEPPERDAEGVRALAWEGHYLMDNGDGHERYSDQEHSCCLQKAVCPGTDVSHFVVAKGVTEFGHFVSTGIVETLQSDDDEKSQRRILTLARRYLVSERDPRCVSGLVDRLQLEAGSLPRPWEHLPLRPKRNTTAAAGSSRGSKRKRGV